MNSPIEATKSIETSLIKDWIKLTRYYLGRYVGTRRGLILVTVAVLAIAGALNWGWLVAIGLAPLLIAIGPCAVMCALGLCMSRMGGQSCSTRSSSTDGSSDARLSSPALSAEVPSKPAVVLPDQKADALPDKRVGNGEEPSAAIALKETTSERS